MRRSRGSICPPASTRSRNPARDIPLHALTRLPEPDDLAALEAAASAAYGASPLAAVVAAPGTQCLINLLPRLFRHRRVHIVGPTYAEHARAWTAAGSEIFVQPGVARA